MTVKGLYVLPGGMLELDKGLITYRTDLGKKVHCPVVMSLVETTEGFVLFDTGLNPRGLVDPMGAWGHKVSPLIAEFRPEDDIRNRLEGLGVKSEDISFVVNSHLHYDHTGGNQFFPRAKFIVQKAEYRFAFFPDDFASSEYVKNHFDYPFDYHLVEGNRELLPGVFLIFTPGHTPGSQSMVLHLPETGTVVLPGDVLYTRESIDKHIPAGNSWNPAQAMMSLNRVVEICKREKGRLFITHEPNIWDTVKAAPYVYR